MAEEFAHDSCESEFLGLSVVEKSLVVFFEDWIESGGD